MAFYSVKECTSETTFIVSGESLTIGQVVSFPNNEQLYCGIITGPTESSTSDEVINTYDSCCECFTANTATFESFQFDVCNSTEIIYMDIQTFCSNYGDVPSSNSVWRLYNLTSGTTVCATFIGPTATSGVTEWIPDNPGPFNSCDNCLIGLITYSAGTEYTACVICDDCCGSGATATSVSVPHPIWTRPDGSAVMLLDAVQLGGMFGLNS